MTTAVEGGEWSTARPGHTLLPGKTQYPFYKRVGGHQGQSGQAENLIPIGIWSWTIQPIVRCYTDWATWPIYVCVCVCVCVCMDIKFGFLCKGKNMGCGCLRLGCRGIYWYLGLQGRRVVGGRKNCMMGNGMVCNPHQNIVEDKVKWEYGLCAFSSGQVAESVTYEN